MADYQHTADIIFRGHFPMDMLRYDDAIPKTDADKIIVRDSHLDCPGTEPQKVTVLTIRKRKTLPWTFKRWESFGAQVQNMVVETW